VAILDREGEFAVDLGDQQAVRRIAERLGPRDVLVHAAAAFDRSSLADLDLATWRRVQAVNVEAKPLGEHGITVNCVAPGLTRTPFTEANLPEQAFEEARARQAVPRTTMPEDIAELVAFLASDAASAITGQTLVADGGSILR
jgi:pyridoxal 4-dehydrogenase